MRSITAISVGIISLVAVLVWLPHNFAMAEQAGGPGFSVRQTRFEFQPVFEGQSVRYAFKVENDGTEPLEIIQVETE
ncbi:MAG: hypothetical protein KGY61_06595 [Desulfobacterales bacterium]|nr:hypothetical protein [Desulfobacterales bacterium]